MKYNNLLNTNVFLLLVFIYICFRLIIYFIRENLIVECFSNLTQTVDLPLTTTVSCRNFCGPTARCAITGQQCFYDTDCPGCKQEKNEDNKTSSVDIPGDDSAGKLTVGVTPRYSPLTSGYGTKERIIPKNIYSKTPNLSLGENTWRDKFDKENKKFAKDNTPKNVPFMQNYPSFYSITGEFSGDGPLPSNI